MPNHTIADILRGLEAKTFSSEEITQQYLNTIAKHDSKYNSFITVTAEQALSQARAADAARQNGNAG
jgi:aspartyl-tRNA(Asn)/glutamyl-tRNA(Gln) amidotransferase subunit A